MPVNESSWQDELEMIKDLARVQGMSSSRLISILRRHLIETNLVGEKNETNRRVSEKLDLRLDGNGNPTYRVVPVNNRNTLVPASINNETIVPTLLDYIDDSVEAVVELGCGYGRHLFALRDLIEHEFPELQYFGCEITANGLSAMQAIAALEPERAPIVSQEFDFRHPSFAFLSSFKKVLFFTCHAIEQVKIIEQDLFLAMIDCAPHIQCVHSEPVGWQYNGSLMREVRTAKEGIVDAIVKVGLFKEIEDRSAAHLPVKLGWNQNLVEQLQALENDGKIKINTVDRNYAGNHFYNPSTLICWTKV